MLATNGHSPATNGNGHLKVHAEKPAYLPRARELLVAQGPPVRDPAKFLSPVTDASPHVFDVKNETYRHPEQPMGTRRSIKVIYIGGGFGGMNFAYMTQKWMKDVDLICYEKNEQIGGTWFENKYPGCRCDIPSHSYQFSWAPTTSWSEYYAGSDEIEAYANKVARDHDLLKYIKLGHKVLKAEWNEDTSLWTVTLKKTDGTIIQDSSHVLINGTGVLNEWRWPDIPDRESFKGDMVHSAVWPKNFDLKNKTVAVIGVGSTAVQIIPNIINDVKHLKSFIRSATWITPSIAQKYAGPDGANFKYTPEQKEAFEKDPQAWLTYRKGIEHEVSARYKYAMKDSPEQAAVLKMTRDGMAAKLAKKPELLERSCRRPTPGNGFLEAITDDKTTVVTSTIERFTPKGLKTADGVEHEVDVIIAATGFNAGFKPSWPIIGKKGIDLRDQWADIAEGYMGITVPNFPNYMITVGPSSPTAHGSVLPLLELIARYQMKLINKLQLEPALRSFEPKAELMREFQVHRLTQLQRTAWSTHCSTWFKNGGPYGTIVAIHPGSRSHFFQVIENIRMEDYDFKYDGNRFSYMGNGFTLREKEGNDLCWYLDDTEKPFLYDYEGQKDLFRTD